MAASVDVTLGTRDAASTIGAACQFRRVGDEMVMVVVVEAMVAMVSDGRGRGRRVRRGGRGWWWWWVKSGVGMVWYSTVWGGGGRAGQVVVRCAGGSCMYR
jgi:hypothetical protein